MDLYKEMKCFVLELLVPKSTSNFVCPKMTFYTKVMLLSTQGQQQAMHLMCTLLIFLILNFKENCNSILCFPPKLGIKSEVLNLSAAQARYRVSHSKER